MRKVVFAILMATLPLSASAGDESAQFRKTRFLYELCTNEDDVAAMGCASYIAGVADAVGTLNAWELSSARICNGGEIITVEVLKLVFIDFIKKNPEDIDDGAASVVVRAFADAYPCQ